MHKTHVQDVRGACECSLVTCIKLATRERDFFFVTSYETGRKNDVNLYASVWIAKKWLWRLYRWSYLYEIPVDNAICHSRIPRLQCRMMPCNASEKRMDDVAWIQFPIFFMLCVLFPIRFTMNISMREYQTPWITEIKFSNDYVD